MTSHGTPVKYLRYDNAGKCQSKLQKVCEKENFRYMIPHTSHLNGFIERIFSVIKEGDLSIILNKKLNDTAQKTLREEAVHTYERM